MKKLCLIMLLFVLFTLPADAESSEQILNEQIENSGLQQTIDELDDQTKYLLEELELDPQSVFSGQGFSFSALIDYLSQWIVQAFRAPALACAGGAAIIILCSMTDNIALKNSQSIDLMENFFAVICMGAVVILPIGELMTKTMTSIGGVGQFMLAFIPVYAGILMQSGRILMAGGAGTAVFGCSEVIIYLANQLFLPILSMLLGLSLCRWISPSSRFESLPSALKKTATWLLGISTTLYSAILMITGAIQGAGDSLTQRTTRYFIGNMVPVVGGALSESLSVVQGCLSLMRTGGGMVGLGVVFVLLLPILVEIILWRVGLYLIASLAEMMGAQQLNGLIRSIGDVVGIVFSVVICCLVVYMVSLGVMASAGNGG